MVIGQPADLEDGYSVEFFDITGRTVVVVTVRESQVRRPTHPDRPAVRALSRRRLRNKRKLTRGKGGGIPGTAL